MTTVQESTNGHRISPPPCPFPDPQAENRSEDSPNNNFTSTPLSPTPTAFPASAYHVPPARFAPKAYPYRHDDTLNLPPETEPLPERCQFMFSDGRQCTMARSDIHPSLCHYHSEREEQLFGDPSPGGGIPGRAYDLPELYSACRDLTTAVGVNRALGQVFRLLAQRRISRQEAATFAKLGHLLLQSISAARAESTDPVSPPRKGYPQDALFAGNQVLPSEYHERGAQFASRTGSRRISPEPTPDREMSPASAPPRPPAASYESPAEPTTAKNSFVMNTSAKAVCNSREISTSDIERLKVAQNQHLQKNTAGEAPTSALGAR